jgi:co-chaperonin GroES (HSP10)
MIVPRDTYVLIQLDLTPQISDIIALSDNTSAQPPARGVVRAIGPKVTAVRAGDTVYFERFDWTLADAVSRSIILKEDEILAKEGV